MHQPRLRGISRQQTLERRLFGWLLALLLVPALLISAAALLVGSRSVELVGTLGPWDEVANSGRSLFDAAAPAARHDTALARALNAHQRELSSSLIQARRWTFLGRRAAAALPWLALIAAMVLVGFSLWISRRIARELARPIAELVGWAQMMGQGLPLPAADKMERDGVTEVDVLRVAMRDASAQIAVAQTRALETERVRAWGEMARRVAHEMKNPLTPLRLAVHRLAQGNAATPGMGEPLEVIEQETARLEDLAKQFAVLGRPSSGPRSDVDLVELVTDLLRSDVPAGIDTNVDVASDQLLVSAHYDALQRALRNLIRNAVEAIMQNGGTGRIDVRIDASDDGVHIGVADNGGGIPAASLAHIFEPDYTLKAGGTGLGLAVVRQAVAAHDGTVTASNNGAGALFDVWLPRTNS